MTDLLEKLEAYAREASIALAASAGLVGSEAFKKIGDQYYADPAFCRQRLDERIESIRKLSALKARHTQAGDAANIVSHDGYYEIDKEAATRAAIATMHGSDSGVTEELERDLILARLGDYPGVAGCKRIAAAYDALRAITPSDEDKGQ